jgi:serum/glucocorticoid-regulated kinase 2
LAPEILRKKPYTKAVDWWCLGSVIYEMLFGLPPFYSRDTSEMYDNILRRPLRMNYNVPATLDARNIISKVIFIYNKLMKLFFHFLSFFKLLHKEQQHRLGSSKADFAELRDHNWFLDINWDDLVEKRIPVPWIPDLDSTTDLKYIDPEFPQQAVPQSLGKSAVTSNNKNGTKDAIFAGIYLYLLNKFKVVKIILFLFK